MQTSLQTQIHTVRRFNRFYTRQIGVLQEHLLASAFSLTEVRVLYEIQIRERCTATDLRRELDLDAGYLSRILRALTKRGLVAKRPSSHDARQQELTLTTLGRKTFSELDQQSSREVEAMLRHLPAANRQHLIHAMRDLHH